MEAHDTDDENEIDGMQEEVEDSTDMKTEPLCKTGLETMVKGLSGNGMNVEFKRQMGNGEYQNATEKDLGLLNSKALIASTAMKLNGMDEDSKLNTALELKLEGNELFKAKNYEMALKTYLQALSASNFGGASESSSTPSTDGNVDTLIVPVLGNMAACCLQINEYVKVVKFCEQILLLRPNNFKASLRKGMGFYYLKEYDLSLESLKHAQFIFTESMETNESKNKGNSAQEGQDVADVCPSSDTPSLNNDFLKLYGTIDRVVDEQKLNLYFAKCRKERLDEKERLKKQKLSLQKAFATGPYAPAKPAVATLQTNLKAIIRICYGLLISVFIYIKTVLYGMFKIKSS